MTPLVYCDTNIFIAAFETAGALCDYAWGVLNAAERGAIDAVTSELSLAELLSKPPEDNPQLIRRYQEIISSRVGLIVLPVDRPVLLQAAMIRRVAASVKLPDVIHLAPAIVGRCTHFLTSDQRLRPVGPAAVKLSPHTLDTLLADAS